MNEASFTSVFTDALRGHPCAVVGVQDEPDRLPVESWTREADADDLALLDHCRGSTIDIGCGPGRMTAALAARGTRALGIDVVHEAVGQTRDRGVRALQRDVFDPLPDEGWWGSALLADGNVGIGGDPVALLQRVRDVVAPSGRIVTEVAPPGVESKTVWAAIECADTRSRRFRWSVLGVDDADDVARRAGLRVTGTSRHGERWCVVLERAAT